MMAWVCKLPEVGDELIAKAKRVDALREEARELEAEVNAAVNQRWSAAERRQAEFDCDPVTLSYGDVPPPSGD